MAKFVCSVCRQEIKPNKDKPVIGVWNCGCTYKAAYDWAKLPEIVPEGYSSAIYYSSPVTNNSAEEDFYKFDTGK
jgi:hypothetical protein